MSGDEITPNDETFASQFPNEATELSDEELDDIAGGLNLQFTFASSRKFKQAFVQDISAGSGCGSAKTAFQTEATESALMQLIITDATTEDLQVLGELFGDTTAIEGSA
jgi:hypothetical protein